MRRPVPPSPSGRSEQRRPAGGGTSRRLRARFSQLWDLATFFVSQARPPRGGERRGEKDLGWTEPRRKRAGKEDGKGSQLFGPFSGAGRGLRQALPRRSRQTSGAGARGGGYNSGGARRGGAGGGYGVWAQPPPPV